MTTTELMKIYNDSPRPVRNQVAFAASLIAELTGAPTAGAAPRATNADPDKQARFRAKLVADIWEPDLRSELVDRIANAAALRWFDMKTLTAAIRRAKSLKYDYEKSDGARGKDAIWKTLATWIKGVYAARGVEWTPTSSALEPRAPSRPTPQPAPEPERGATTDGDGMTLSERYKLYQQKMDAAK